MIQGKITGSFPITNSERALATISKIETMIDCIPGATRSGDKTFKVQAKVALLTITLEGEVKEFVVADNVVRNVISVRGPGVNATVSSQLTVNTNNLEYQIEYKAEVSQVLEGIVKREIDKVSNEIVQCTRRKVTG
jgi:carbon monoxide dehydrogenase subunit G